MSKKKTILVTGSSGFIGMHFCELLLKKSYQVIGIDNMNDYYDVALKKNRLTNLLKYKNFKFLNEDITNIKILKNIFKEFKPYKVINLAAQAGVRYSVENPQAYIDSNVTGFMNILECVRYHNAEGLIYASSSSVYGGSTKEVFSVADNVDKPISIYAATKKANELMAYSYSHLYKIHTTGLRYFTVYGPYGRPDMTISIFAHNIVKNEELIVFNKGRMKRDFTYIDDIVNGTFSAMEKNYFCEVFNLGNNNPINLKEMIKLIEKNFNSTAKIKYVGNQLGDVKFTCADINYSKEKLEYSPKVSFESGIKKFVEWFKAYHHINNI